MLDEPTNPTAKHGATVVLVSGGVESAALLSCEEGGPASLVCPLCLQATTTGDASGSAAVLAA